MTSIALDTETFLIKPGLAAPPMVCTTWANDGLDFGLCHVREDAKECWLGALESSDLLYGLNMAYDTAVVCAQWPELFALVGEAYFDDRIRDVGLDQRLIDIYNDELEGRFVDNEKYDPSQPTKGKNKPLRWIKHKYSLAALTERHYNEVMRKGADTWRMRYSQLLDVAADQWPADATHYAQLDAVNTMRVHLAQQSLDLGTYTVAEVLNDSGPQARAAFALHLMSCRGIRTDGPKCRALIEAAEREIERCRDLCFSQGLIERNKKGGYTKKLAPAREFMIGALLRANGLPDTNASRKDLAAAVTQFVLESDAREGINIIDFEDGAEIAVSLTEKGEICLDAEACKDTSDPVLRAYATYTSATTLRSKTKRMLMGATIPLQTRFQPLIETGRTSSSKSTSPLVGDNFQNFRRKGMKNELDEELPGQRECIIPRRGYVLGSIDLDNAEMRSMGQACIWTAGSSKLADSLNRGEDAHLALACSQLLTAQITYEQAKALLKLKDAELKNARQFAKVPNFALLGGARALTMIPYAKGMGITLTEDRAHELYAAFHQQWPEIGPYHRMIKNALREGHGAFHFEQFVSKRIRKIRKYTVGCNTGFQGLTADGAKASLAWLAMECYTGNEYNWTGPNGGLVATGKRSPLLGAYPVLFCHDEVIYEFVRERAHEQAYRARDIQKIAYDFYTPDVPMTCEPCLMEFWDKDASTKFDVNGRLTWAA